MPLTFCHPALILPFKAFPKKWFSIVGLVVGSMMPDFEYFIKMQINIGVGHSIRGIILFNVPAGIILTYVFFYIVSKDFINSLPLYFKSRLWFIKKIDWHTYFKNNWYIVISSIIIGVLSHLFWDAFTHFDGFVVLRYPVLSNKICFYSYMQPVYNILQYVSTFVGGIIILFYISTLKPEPDIKPSNVIGYWIKVTAITILILLLRIGIGGFGHSVYFTSIICSIAAVLYAIILTPLLFRQPEN